MDVLATPVCPGTAFPFGEKTTDPLAMYLSDVFTVTPSLAALPALQNDGMPEEPARLLLRLAGEIETEDAATLDGDKALAFEQTLMSLSDAVSDRYFLQGSKATPTKKLGGLA